MCLCFRWLEYVDSNIGRELLGEANISWAAYHASRLPGQDLTPAISTLLPLFPDSSQSVAMIRHAMDVVKLAVQEVNPGQITVVTLDQPLYAIAKQIQWNWPESHGESQFVIILGGLHIEMCSLKLIGDWLEDSGWVEALVQAKVSSPGTADSFVKVSHITRTRRAHQVTASSLHILLKRAYNQYKEGLAPDQEPNDFNDWCVQRKNNCPQFLFWYTALQLQLLVFTYIRSLREANFPLYVDCLTKLAPWCFALDHTNYARWLPVHVRDMASLGETHPDVATEFGDGKFTVQKTCRVFSSIAIDQAHEQNNAIVKGDGGAVGLMQSPESLRRWCVAGPEMARMISEFELAMQSGRKTDKDTRHHDQTSTTQMTFAKNVKSMVEVIEEMGNPFTEDTKDLLKLDTREIADEATIIAVQQAEEIGYTQYDNYVTERLLGQKSISDTISKNKLPLFNRPPPKAQSKEKLQVSSLRNDCALFSRLYIACQTRDGNLDEFFKHENQAYPPSLSQHGSLRLGTKSDILSCVENCAQSQTSAPEIEVTILDGAAVVHMLMPGISKTFDEYAQNVFLPYIQSHLHRSSRVDIVWDVYVKNSLKSQTRSKRGKGIRRRVQGSQCIPSNWQSFLRVEGNKTELFAFLARHVVHIMTDKQVVTTDGPNVLCMPPQDTSNLSPCNHEEADSRMMLHIADAVNKGFQKVLLRTVDSDVVVLAVGIVAKLTIQELWVAFGTSQNYRFIPAHEIAASLGPERSKALSMFHAYTGCDTVSSFATKGKKTAWDVWKAYDEVTTAFIAASAGPEQVSDEIIAVLERFTILLYDRTSSKLNINDARQELFTKKGRGMDAIPPTKDALIHHIKRAVYQGGYCWGRSLEAAHELPSPADWGWTNPNEWRPLWTTLPQASQSSRELLCCGCRKGCRGNCKCTKAALKCTALCQCSGDCDA